MEAWDQDGRGGGSWSCALVLTAVVADVAQSSAGLQKDLLVCGAEQLDERRDEAGLHAGAPHELWQGEQTHQCLELESNLVQLHRTNVRRPSETEPFIHQGSRSEACGTFQSPETTAGGLACGLAIRPSHSYNH